jgi:hypothetical protein
MVWTRGSDCCAATAPMETSIATAATRERHAGHGERMMAIIGDGAQKSLGRGSGEGPLEKKPA